MSPRLDIKWRRIRNLHSIMLFALFLPILNALGRPSGSYAKRSTDLRDLQELFAQQPPHCARATVSVAAPSILHDSQPSSPRMRLNAGVGNTVCFRMSSPSASNNDSVADVLHTLTLVRLEQYYPISQRFRFGIPEVETKCICECQANAKTCQPAEYSYGKCPGQAESTVSTSLSAQPEACHRTFFADQPANGCPGGHADEPKLCCELRFRPYQNRTFTALRLESPTTFGVLRYSAFEWSERARWSQVDRRAISIHLDGSTQSQYLDSAKDIELSITSPGQSNNQLEPGMYFVENLPHGKYGELRRQPLNEITEHNFEKLGWFRVNPENEAFVQGGFVLMDKIHKAKAENCVEQKYQSILDANYYVNKDSNETTRFRLSEPLDSTLRWVKRARLVDSAERHVIVDANEGTNLELSLSTVSSTVKLNFVHNASRIVDFNALILVDQFSNSVLNLTMFNASGVLNGYLKHISDQHAVTIDSFTVQVPDEEMKLGVKSVIVRIKPYEANSQHMICLRADDGRQSELCRLATSMHLALETNTVRNRWHGVRGACADCNQFTMEGFMHFLNPANWVKGVHSVGDAVMLLSDIVGYVFVILLVYLLVFKLLIPLVRCFACPLGMIPCGGDGKK